jgi:adenine/guanine phosphoribosyltransferase-like PRPP-binding protein
MDGKRILLIDDTRTTGATAQGAASALSNGGATVVGILTIGRVIKAVLQRDRERVLAKAARSPSTVHV